MQQAFRRCLSNIAELGLITSVPRRNARVMASTVMDDLPRVVECHQGEQVKPTFSAHEMQCRLDKLRRYMADTNIEACVFTSIHNINYFSNFLYCAFGRPYALVVTMDDSTTVSANIDYGMPSRRTFGKNITYTDWQRDNYFYAVRNLVGNGGNMGIEYDHMNLNTFAKFKDWFPKSEFQDVGLSTMQMRMLKSTEEIEHITNGANICEIGAQAIVSVLKEGISEYEVALASTQAMVREIARTYPHADLMDTWTWFQSGINTDGAHNPVTSRKIRKGDILSLNCFPMIAGYYTALERTMFLDYASDEALRFWEINCEVHRRGIELLVPGNKCKDIAAELNEMLKQYGVFQYRTFGYGHSFGVLSHYYGREAGLELREDIETVLQPNMVVSMEPMITIPEDKLGAGGYREHDILVITNDGNINITKFPFGPDHNIIKSK